MPPKFDEMWGAEFLNTRLPLHTSIQRKAKIKQREGYHGHSPPNLNYLRALGGRRGAMGLQHVPVTRLLWILFPLGG